MRARTASAAAAAASCAAANALGSTTAPAGRPCSTRTEAPLGPAMCSDIAPGAPARRPASELLTSNPGARSAGDHGTHDLGIVTVRDAKDLQALQERTRTLSKGSKSAFPPHDFLVQEGVLTQERVNDAVAEPVVYMMDRYVVGGFYRVHAGRGVDENLNAPGSQYIPLAFAESTHLPQLGMPPGASAPNRFYMYGVIGRLAMLAASYELEATDPRSISVEEVTRLPGDLPAMQRGAGDAIAASIAATSSPISPPDKQTIQNAPGTSFMPLGISMPNRLVSAVSGRNKAARRFKRCAAAAICREAAA